MRLLEYTWCRMKTDQKSRVEPPMLLPDHPDHQRPRLDEPREPIAEDESQAPEEGEVAYAFVL